MNANEIYELVKQVRKHGSVKVADKATAVAVCRSARENEWCFAQHAEFGGFVVEDLGDNA